LISEKNFGIDLPYAINTSNIKKIIKEVTKYIFRNIILFGIMNIDYG